MFEVATGTSAAILTNISALFADPEIKLIICLAAGIPFGFYVIKKLISMVPKGK